MRFFARLASMPDIEYVHRRSSAAGASGPCAFFDPDRHIVEVGAYMTAVCRRFLENGMSAERAAARMDVPAGCVRARAVDGVPESV